MIVDNWDSNGSEREDSNPSREVTTREVKAEVVLLQIKWFSFFSCAIAMQLVYFTNQQYWRSKEVSLQVVDTCSLYSKEEEGWEDAVVVDENPDYE